MRFIASIVGSSWKIADTSGVAPIRSPAETNNVFGFVARRSWHVAGEELGSTRGRSSDATTRAGGIRRPQLMMEVVERQDLNLRYLSVALT